MHDIDQDLEELGGVLIRDTESARRGVLAEAKARADHSRVHAVVRPMASSRLRAVCAGVATAGLLAGALTLGLMAHRGQQRSPAAPASNPAASTDGHAIVVLTSSDASTVAFVRDDGIVLARHSASGHPFQVVDTATADGEFWYVAPSTDFSVSHLHSLTISGVDRDLGPMPGFTVPGSLVVSPDGRQWGWITGPEGKDARESLLIAGQAQAPRTALVYAGKTQALAWTARGILITECCHDKAGYGIRSAMLLDPTTLRVTDTWQDCDGAAAAPDGTVACYTSRTARPDPTVIVHRTDGSSVTAQATAPFELMDTALVDTGGSMLVFGVAHSITVYPSGSATPGQAEWRPGYVLADSLVPPTDRPYLTSTVDTQVADLATGTVSRLAQNARPLAILPDERILAATQSGFSILRGGASSRPFGLSNFNFSGVILPANPASGTSTSSPTPIPTAQPTSSATCTSAQLAAAWGGPVSEATGQHSLLLALTNTSAGSCSLDGYPTLVLADAAGKPIPFDYRDAGDQMVTSHPPAVVELAPRHAAYLMADKYRCDRGDQTQAVTVRITPPGDSGALSLAWGASPGIAYCGAGDPGSTVYLSPIEASFAAVLSRS